MYNKSLYQNKINIIIDILPFSSIQNKFIGTFVCSGHIVSIGINKSTQEFEENTQKVENIKDKIEKEIIEIDKLYEKVNKEIIDYFKRKHEELIKKEKDIKDNLQNEVTKTKEKL